MQQISHTTLTTLFTAVRFSQSTCLLLHFGSQNCIHLTTPFPQSLCYTLMIHYLFQQSISYNWIMKNAFTTLHFSFSLTIQLPPHLATFPQHIYHTFVLHFGHTFSTTRLLPLSDLDYTFPPPTYYTLVTLFHNAFTTTLCTIFC